MNTYGAQDPGFDRPLSEPDPDYAYDQMLEEQSSVQPTPWCWCCHADVIDCNCGIEECPDCHRCENCCNCGAPTEFPEAA